jgi:hypothetical protein
VFGNDPPFRGSVPCPDPADTTRCIRDSKGVTGIGALFGLAIIAVVGGLPAYVIGRRSGVHSAWVAFVPLVGTTLVLLWSIRQTGWLVLLAFIPFLDLLFLLWLVFALPRTHHRRGLWGLGLLVPLVGIYAYAFTLAPRQYALSHRTA